MEEQHDRAIDALRSLILAGTMPDEAAADAVAAWPPAERARLVAALLPSAVGRRWLRSAVLGRVPPDEAADLAARLVAYAEDFAAARRDRTTAAVIAALPEADLRRFAPTLAGGNAASALWERLSTGQSAMLVEVALDVLRHGDARARETTLLLVLADPLSAARLDPPQRTRLIGAALANPDDEGRGLAVELAADQVPELLIDALDRWVRDPSERARMAAWDVALAHAFDHAVDLATRLITDETVPLPARRTALAALGSALPTHDVAPILATMVAHPVRELAEDAANLMWAYHRTPVVAQAAAGSPHPAVRTLAERLLHPEHGSPAAGGSRPGAPTPDDAGAFYEEMLRRPKRG